VAQTLGTEWADRGVRVNCMSPGIVNTALIQVRCCDCITERLLVYKGIAGGFCSMDFPVASHIMIACSAQLCAQSELHLLSSRTSSKVADENAAMLQESKDLQPLVKEWLTQIPAARLAEVTDLQAAIVYMASDASDYMVGHNLVIDGGQSVW